jgi:hypothetical protein
MIITLSASLEAEAILLLRPAAAEAAAKPPEQLPLRSITPLVNPYHPVGMAATRHPTGSIVALTSARGGTLRERSTRTLP